MTPLQHDKSYAHMDVHMPSTDRIKDTDKHVATIERLGYNHMEGNEM